MNTRRQFLATSLAAAAGGATSSLLAQGDSSPKGHDWHFCTFTKPFQHLSYEETAKVIADLGFQGIEAPVRPGGHVEPERVEEDLPKLVDALKKEGLEITIMASGINAVTPDQHTEKVLRTAAGLGVKRFRMSYYRYDLKQPIFAQLDEFRPQLKDLIALSKEVGIKPVYQNHSGKNYVGAPLWDLHELMREYDPSEIGSAFDIGHATIEGAKCWPLHFQLMQPYIECVYIKAPHWDDNTLTMGSLGDGALDQGFFKMLQQIQFSGPVNLHVEYLNHKDPESVPATIEATKKDFATLKEWLTA